MGRKKVTGKSDESIPPPPRLALSILEFCDAHGISEGFYYKLKKQRKGPREMRLGKRTLVTFESAAEWRRERELASAAEAASKAENPAHPEGRAKAKPAKSARGQHEEIIA
jgi:hypothetical protein